MYVEIELKKKKKKEILILKVWFYGNSVKLRQSPAHALLLTHDGSCVITAHMMVHVCVITAHMMVHICVITAHMMVHVRAIPVNNA